MPETRTPRLPRISKDTGPLWARANRLFYADSFDVRSKKDFVEAMKDFVELSPAEQAFHQTHLLFRQVQALEDVHACLGRIEKAVAVVDLEALGALKELVPIRKSLRALVVGQEDMIEWMEENLENNQEESDLEAATEGESSEEGPAPDDLPHEIEEDLPADPVETPEVIVPPAPRKPKPPKAPKVIDVKPG
jgi:hypothetical protein